MASPGACKIPDFVPTGIAAAALSIAAQVDAHTASVLNYSGDTSIVSPSMTPVESKSLHTDSPRWGPGSHLDPVSPPSEFEFAIEGFPKLIGSAVKGLPVALRDKALMSIIKACVLSPYFKSVSPHTKPVPECGIPTRMLACSDQDLLVRLIPAAHINVPLPPPKRRRRLVDMNDPAVRNALFAHVDFHSNTEVAESLE